MMKPLRTLIFCITLVFLGMSLWSKDFGLVLDQTPGISGHGKETRFGYTGILIPRFTALLGDEGKLYASMGINFQSNPVGVVPEILRTELSWRFDHGKSGGGELRLGRMFYSDPLGFVAQGLFDGARYSIDTGVGSFSAGAWYTGFLYKKRTEISMTGDELRSLYADLDYSNFSDTYFAPKRVISAFGWEHPLLRELVRLRVDLIGQFDLEGTGLHTQYAAAKASFPLGNFFLNFGGCFSLIQNDGEFGIGLAGELAAAWMLPAAVDSRLLFFGRFSSGEFENSPMCAFLPITNNYQGEILQGKLSALSIFGLDYLCRVLPTLSVNATASYFIRSDLGTFMLLGNEGYFLGTEIFGRALWSPFSDLLFNFGCGVFLPQTGNAASDVSMLWRIELGIIFSLY